MKIDRILDANVNRVAEGIRVIEDIRDKKDSKVSYIYFLKLIV